MLAIGADGGGGGGGGGGMLVLGRIARNLSTHLRKLEDAGYIELAKTHERRLPVTYVSLTRAGRRAFEDYTAALRTLLASADGAPVDVR